MITNLCLEQGATLKVPVFVYIVSLIFTEDLHLRI